MTFSIKQLLFCTAVVAFGLAALLNEYRPLLGKLFDLLTLGILIAMAYGAWLSSDERRAFRVGFLCWALLYAFLFKETFDIGINDLIGRAYRAVTPPPPPGFGGGGFGGGGGFQFQYSSFNQAFHSMFPLLLGLVGGWLTVYLYRRRERMLAK